jgi:hypothetical protein
MIRRRFLVHPLLVKTQLRPVKMFLLAKKIKVIFVLTLAVIFFYITAKSKGKFLSDPIFSKIVYKFGEDDKGYGRFPAISFCRPPYGDNKLKWKNQRVCSKKPTTYIFIDFIENCLTSAEENVTIEKLLKEITYQPEDLFLNVQSYYIPQLTPDNWKNVIFYDYYDLIEGHCLTLDVNKLTQEGHVLLSNPLGNFYIKLNPWVDTDDNGLFMYFHDNKDIYHLKEFFPYITWSGSGFIEINVQPKIVKSLPNKETPCVQQPFWTCYIEKLIGQLMLQYNCNIPFLLGTKNHNLLQICKKNHN